MKVGGRLIATVAVAAGLVAPASAQAAISARVTDDAGNPVALSEGVPAALKTMDFNALINMDEGVGWKSSMTGPDGMPTGIGVGCGLKGSERTNYGEYHGNGIYTLTVTVFSDKCDGKVSRTATYSWTVTAGVAVSPPAPTMLTREPNSFSTITQQFNFAGNPGASDYEIKYAKGAVVNPDGSLNSPALKDAYVNSTTGKVELIGAREPGAYTMVARARKGSYYSPWSAPAMFNLIAPFDLSSRSFPDSRGPSYQVRAIVGEPTAAGSRVTVAAAKGKNGRHFRTLGKAKVNSQGVFKLRFHLARGTYRMRYSFRGNATVARGTVYEVVRVKRVLG